MSGFDPAKFAERLGMLRKAHGLRQTGIANRFGLSKQLVNAWEHARPIPSLHHIFDLAKLYEIGVGELLTGEALPESSRAGGPMSGVVGTAVPLCTEPEICEVARCRKGRTYRRKWVISKSACSNEFLAFHVFDRSMTPGFASDYLEIRGSEIQPQPGDCIAVVLGKEDRTVFRRYRPARDGLEVEAPYDLRSSNPDFETLSIQVQDEPIFVGTPVEHTRFGSAR